MRFPRFAYLLMLFPVVFAGDCPGEAVDGSLSGSDEDVASPEIRIQVMQVEPETVAPGNPFKATIFGSGFANGAAVTVSGVPVVAATVRDPNSISVEVQSLSSGVHDVEVRNPNGESAVLRGGIYANASALVDRTVGLECDRFVVPFDFDSFQVSAAGQAALEENFACFQGRTGTVRLEGHCDERGTTEYNLALGARRASAVQRWLIGRDILPGRLETVTYGEERPAAKGQGEQAWDQNRRVEVRVAR